MEQFTVVMDRAAAMEFVANASVPRDLCPLDETWMNCLAHFLDNFTKSVLATYSQGRKIQVVVQDFNTLKKVIEDAYPCS